MFIFLLKSRRKGDAVSALAEHIMKQEKTLSIIVPTYNMEGLLRRCVMSAVEAGRDGRLEVIVVNDGSTDASSALAHEIEGAHPGVVRVVDKANAHYGSCVNAGLPMARGRYVKIVDADDHVDTANLSALLDVLDGLDADVVFAPFVLHRGGGKDRLHIVRLPPGRVLDIGKLWGRKAIVAAWHHEVFYNRRLLYGYRQLEHCLYTDNQWTFRPLLTARTVYAFGRPIYVYNLEREGQSVSAEVRDANWIDDLRCAKAMIDDYRALDGETRMEGARKRCAERKVLSILRRGYRHCLLYGSPRDLEALRSFDSGLGVSDPDWHRLAGRLWLMKQIRWPPFVEWWRKDPGSSKLRAALALYKGLKRHK